MDSTVALKRFNIMEWWQGNGKITVTDVTEVEGDAYLNNRKGKIRLGFELKCKVLRILCSQFASAKNEIPICVVIKMALKLCRNYNSRWGSCGSAAAGDHTHTPLQKCLHDT
jgi:hypothetical protein